MSDPGNAVLVPVLLEADDRGLPTVNRVRQYLAAKAAAYEATDAESARYLKTRLTEIAFTGASAQEQAWAIGQLAALVKTAQRGGDRPQRLLSADTRALLERVDE